MASAVADPTNTNEVSDTTSTTPENQKPIDEDNDTQQHKAIMTVDDDVVIVDYDTNKRRMKMIDTSLGHHKL
jgi:hypothetical protein